MHRDSCLSARDRSGQKMDPLWAQFGLFPVWAGILQFPFTLRFGRRACLVGVLTVSEEGEERDSLAGVGVWRGAGVSRPAHAVAVTV